MSVAIPKPPRTVSPTRLLRLSALGAVALFALTILLGSWYTVDQGERAVLLRNGAFVSVEGPGLHFKIPWIEAVRLISVQTQTEHYDKVNSYSQDQQPADIRVSATFHIDPAGVDVLYSRFGSLDAAVSRVVTPHIFQELKVVFRALYRRKRDPGTRETQCRSVRRDQERHGGQSRDRPRVRADRKHRLLTPIRLLDRGADAG